MGYTSPRWGRARCSTPTRTEKTKHSQERTDLKIGRYTGKRKPEETQEKASGLKA
jgi:hypothetical protein